MASDESADRVWRTISIFRDRWFVLVLHRLLEGPRRQAEFLREIDGISQRMLTRTLRQMEVDGVVTRRTVRLKPLHVEYALTGRGQSLHPLLAQVLQWSRAYDAAGSAPTNE